jgi:hypothetical protein
MKGFARIEPAAFVHVAAPVVICSGHWGAFPQFGVYGSILSQTHDRRVEVYCTAPAFRTTLLYQETVLGWNVPRKLYAYVWLERHDEFAEQCSASSTPTLVVEYETMMGSRSNVFSQRPCDRPIDINGSVGFAIGFDRPSPDRDDYGDVEVRPGGYLREFQRAKQKADSDEHHQRSPSDDPWTGHWP